MSVIAQGERKQFKTFTLYCACSMKKILCCIACPVMMMLLITDLFDSLLIVI